MMARPHGKGVLTLAALFIVLLGLVDHSSGQWSYEGEEGPSSWYKQYPDCGGSRQSPINIKTSTAQITTGPRPVWKYYNLAPARTTLLNNGHTLQIIATRANTGDGKNPQLLIDGKIFELDQTHFHWGKSDKNGSEHTFNGIRYPLEMHSVHRRTVNGTRVDPPEVVVTTILFELSYERNRGLDRFLKYVPSVTIADVSVTIPPFPVDTLIPQFDAYYYYYLGSLTTPPCSEVVTFYIRQQCGTVSHDQLETLRIPLNHESEEIAGNFRPLQPRNNRAIMFVKP